MPKYYILRIKFLFRNASMLFINQKCYKWAFKIFVTFGEIYNCKNADKTENQPCDLHPIGRGKPNLYNTQRTDNICVEIQFDAKRMLNIIELLVMLVDFLA